MQPLSLESARRYCGPLRARRLAISDSWVFYAANLTNRVEVHALRGQLSCPPRARRWRLIIPVRGNFGVRL